MAYLYIAAFLAVLFTWAYLVDRKVKKDRMKLCCEVDPHSEFCKLECR